MERNMNVSNNTSQTIIQSNRMLYTHDCNCHGSKGAKGSHNRASLASEPQELTQSLQNTLGISSESGQVDEEQLQHGLTQHILNELHPEAATAYREAFASAQSQGQATEDAVKSALKDVVAQGALSESRAEQISGLTFRAAQLDNNLDALYDGKGGPNDPTVATASLSDAVKMAEATLVQIRDGGITPSIRDLDAASNVAPTHSSSAVFGSANVGGSNEFLWKPRSESDGNLVALIPSQYSGQIVDAGIYSSSEANSSSLIEQGRFTGDTHNGGRSHFRFSKEGGSYPDGVFLNIKLLSGQTVSFPINDSASRNTR